MHRFEISSNKRVNGFTFYTLEEFNFSSFVASKAPPLILFSPEVSPKLSGVPSTAVFHFANSSKFHFFTGVVLLFCTHSGLLNFSMNTEPFYSTSVELFVAISVPLTLIQTKFSVSLLMKRFRSFLSSSNRFR